MVSCGPFPARSVGQVAPLAGWAVRASAELVVVVVALAVAGAAGDAVCRRCTAAPFESQRAEWWWWKSHRLVPTGRRSGASPRFTAAASETG